MRIKRPPAVARARTRRNTQPLGKAAPHHHVGLTRQQQRQRIQVARTTVAQARRPCASTTATLACRKLDSVFRSHARGQQRAVDGTRGVVL